MKKEYDFYIASGWFTPEQELARLDIVNTLKLFGVKFFSPKDEIICPINANSEVKSKIFSDNINAINKSFFMISSTVGKDMGAIFEAGHANGLNMPIIYYCPGLKGSFNLMLAETAVAVATTIEELREYVGSIMKNKFYFEKYEGNIE